MKHKFFFPSCACNSLLKQIESSTTAKIMVLYHYFKPTLPDPKGLNLYHQRCAKFLMQKFYTHLLDENKANCDTIERDIFTGKILRLLIFRVV